MPLNVSSYNNRRQIGYTCASRPAFYSSMNGLEMNARLARTKRLVFLITAQFRRDWKRYNTASILFLTNLQATHFTKHFEPGHSLVWLPDACWRNWMKLVPKGPSLEWSCVQENLSLVQDQKCSLNREGYLLIASSVLRQVSWLVSWLACRFPTEF